MVAVHPLIEHMKDKSDLTDKAEIFKLASSTAFLLSTSSGIVAKH
jgi:hypothetical protein